MTNSNRTGRESNKKIIGIAIMGVGVVLVFIGLIFYNLYSGGQDWWVWALLALGLICVTVGALMLQYYGHQLNEML